MQKITFLVIILALAFGLLTSTNYLSTLAIAQTPKGTVVNSKYLSITEHRFREGSYFDQITGTIVNNSTAEISGLYVYAALYDVNNQLITMKSGDSDVYTLPPNDFAPFSVGGLNKEMGIDHYILYPAGTP